MSISGLERRLQRICRAGLGCAGGIGQQLASLGNYGRCVYYRGRLEVVYIFYAASVVQPTATPVVPTDKSRLNLAQHSGCLTAADIRVR